MDRKKLYRKRTMEEVARRFSYTVSNATDSSDSSDPAKQTVDTAIDTTRFAGNQTAETIKAYSDKLRNKPAGETRSEILKHEGGRESSVNSKKLQKEKIKRNYAKTAREAQQAGKTAGKNTAKAGKKAAEETESLVSAAMKKVAEFVAEHPIGALLSIMFIIILLAFMCTLNSCGMMFGGVSSGGISASYSAEDTDIYGAESGYLAKEADLQYKVNNAPSLYSGYDEYRYNVDPIEHDPWHLTSVLTVLHEDFSVSDVSGTMASLFDVQYDFSVSGYTETRYRTESRTGYYAVTSYDAEGNPAGTYYVPYTYYVEVPYDYHILVVTLVNNGFDTAVDSLGLDADKTELYNYLNETKGEKAYLY